MMSISMKRSSTNSEIGVTRKKEKSSSSDQVVAVELGLNLQDNLNRSFLYKSSDYHNLNYGVGGPTCGIIGSYNNSLISSNTNTSSTTTTSTTLDIINNNNNNNNVTVGDSLTSDPCTTTTSSAVGVLRSLQPFDASSYLANYHPFFKPLGGGMAAAMGFPFTAAQWKELERQAMIYKYMMASLPVPPDLLYASFSPASSFTPASYFMGKYPYGSALSVRWGGNSKDAEPGRCRRTDGKKWRCSRDVAPNQKYCERHMHRGRPRSRKHVEQQQHQQQLLHQTHHSLSDLPFNTDDSNISKINDSLIKKTRLNDSPNVQPVVSCAVQQPSKANVFDHPSNPMVSGSNPFEDSRSLAWSDEQQWHQIMQTNIYSSGMQHQFEGQSLNLNSNSAYNAKADMNLLDRPMIDAWSMGVTETKDIPENNHDKCTLPLLDAGLGYGSHKDTCQIHMGLGLIDSWVASSTTPGGPLAEVLRPGSASNATLSDAAGEFVTPSATAVSSPSGVLQKTFATFSDSSGGNSPTYQIVKQNSDMPFHWLN